MLKKILTSVPHMANNVKITTCKMLGSLIFFFLKKKVVEKIVKITNSNRFVFWLSSALLIVFRWA